MKEVSRYKWDQMRFDPAKESFTQFLQKFKRTTKQVYGEKSDQLVKNFLFGKLPIKVQQELTIANLEDASPDEIKKFLQRRFQYQQFLRKDEKQPFNPLYTKNEPNQPTDRQSKRFNGNCNYCSKYGHKAIDCRTRLREEAQAGANKLTPNDGQKNVPQMSQPTNERTNIYQKPPYQGKLVCQICGYTGHSARDCNHRTKTKEQLAQLPIPKQNQQTNNETRREIKRNYRPNHVMNEMTPETIYYEQQEEEPVDETPLNI